MNYVSEINEFYDWLETNQLSKSAIALWHALMHINYKARWQETFAVAISTIESKTGFKRVEICKARNVLQQKGRIKWIERGGSKSAEYSIIPFCVHTVNTSVYTNGYTKGTQMDTQTDTITVSKYSNAAATGGIALTGEIVKEISVQAWNDVGWREQVCIVLYLKTEDLQRWLSSFDASIIGQQLGKFNVSRYKKMSQGWIKYKIEKGDSLPAVPAADPPSRFKIL